MERIKNTFTGNKSSYKECKCHADVFASDVVGILVNDSKLLKEWDKLANQLEIPGNYIFQIETQLRQGLSSETAISEILKLWISASGSNATVKALRKALKQDDFVDLNERLTKYQESVRIVSFKSPKKCCCQSNGQEFESRAMPMHQGVTSNGTCNNFNVGLQTPYRQNYQTNQQIFGVGKSETKMHYQNPSFIQPALNQINTPHLSRQQSFSACPTSYQFNPNQIPNNTSTMIYENERIGLPTSTAQHCEITVINSDRVNFDSHQPSAAIDLHSQSNSSELEGIFEKLNTNCPGEIDDFTQQDTLVMHNVDEKTMEGDQKLAESIISVHGAQFDVIKVKRIGHPFKTRPLKVKLKPRSQSHLTVHEAVERFNQSEKLKLKNIRVEIFKSKKRSNQNTKPKAWYNGFWSKKNLPNVLQDNRVVGGGMQCRNTQLNASCIQLLPGYYNKNYQQRPDNPVVFQQQYFHQQGPPPPYYGSTQSLHQIANGRNHLPGWR